MNFHVSGKVSAVFEGFFTNRAHIRSFSCMNSQMVSQMSFMSKGFITYITSVLYKFEISCHES